MEYSSLENRIEVIKLIIQNYLYLVTQNDLDVLKNFDGRIKHHFYDLYQKLTPLEKARFDAGREYDLIEDEEWLKLIKDIKLNSQFKKLPLNKNKLNVLGNKKKQHELHQLETLLNSHRTKKVADFGGGVGNLSVFMAEHLNMEPTVFDYDTDLIRTGQEKIKKNTKKAISFKEFDVCKDNFEDKDFEFGIGLHCCGSFGTELIKLFGENHFVDSMLFSCCYSKIKDEDDYKLSSHAIDFELNTRALSSATLSFNKVELNLYQFRLKIIDYKYSFYHLLGKKHDQYGFFSMSNSRRNLYKLSFYEFYLDSINKYCSDISPLSKDEVESFFYSNQNRELVEYFTTYYAFSRYIGEAIETYILLDRAIYLKEKGAKVEIIEAFDPEISPRCKGIKASFPH